MAKVDQILANQILSLKKLSVRWVSPTSTEPAKDEPKSIQESLELIQCCQRTSFQAIQTDDKWASTEANQEHIEANFFIPKASRNTDQQKARSNERSQENACKGVQKVGLRQQRSTMSLICSLKSECFPDLINYDPRYKVLILQR